MTETWKQIIEFEGTYEISDLGRCRNAKTMYILKEHDNGKGYKTYALWNKSTNKYVHKYAHRLVAEAFVENANNYPEINHVDENKSNNKIDNLEWCTRQYNNTFGKLTQNKMKKVRQLSLDGTVMAIFSSIAEASAKTKSSSTHIGNVCRGERNVCGGFKWEYA